MDTNRLIFFVSSTNTLILRRFGTVPSINNRRRRTGNERSSIAGLPDFPKLLRYRLSVPRSDVVQRQDTDPAENHRIRGAQRLLFAHKQSQFAKSRHLHVSSVQRFRESGELVGHCASPRTCT